MWKCANAQSVDMSSQNKFTVISTFSGCGGSSLGYQLAGGKVLLAVEMDDNAMETYRLNFPDTPIYHGDIHNLTVDKILTQCNLKPGELDILDGSPPCQGFSTAGKRDYCDPRNQLYNEYIRLLRGLKPKVFVMENVSGLVKGKMKVIFADILKELKASGYKVSVRLMNAMYYNVPQSRQRLIFIGVREDLKIEPSHPRPESKPIPVKQAIMDLVGKDIPHLLHKRHFRAKNSKSTINWYNTKHGDPVLGFQLIKLDPNKPAGAIRKSSEDFHYSEARPLTCREYARLHSFPDSFNFINNHSGHERIGNSVPPNFMKAIASHIYNEILSKI